ncbi:A kinase (PRKA) anchor protein 1b isoform 1-T3 [Synchiropus picturatus]
MPLKLRSVIPYTLPGVLALIGWWWFISRKKERHIGHNSPEGASNHVTLRDSPIDGSNGLAEKVAHCPDNDTSLTDQRKGLPNVSHERGPSLKQTAAELVLHPDETNQELGEPAVPVLASPEGRLGMSPEGCKDPENLPPSTPLSSDVSYEERELLGGPKEIISCQSIPNICSSPTTLLSEAERPEPEGEVAKHQLTSSLQNDGCTISSVEKYQVTSAKSCDISSSIQDSHQIILTSTPSSLNVTSPAPSTFQDLTIISATPESINAQRSTGEEQTLELLAAELITEVITAATQEVLCVSGSVASTNSISCSSFHQCSDELVSPSWQNQNLTSNCFQSLSESAQTGSTQTKLEGMSNGCSSSAWKSVDDYQSHKTGRGHWPESSHHDLQSTSPKVKLKGIEAPSLAEDSACSTCLSEGDITSRELHTGLFDNKADMVQITDLSGSDHCRSPLPEERAMEASVLALTEESQDGALMCDTVQLDGDNIRNGAHLTFEADADQSGGESTVGSDVNSMDSVDSGCTMGGGDSQSNLTSSQGSEPVVWEIEVPKHLVGRLIGKQGRYVSFLKQTSGAMIYISILPYTQDFQICHIEGTQQQVDKALSLIGKKFKDLDLTNFYAPPPPPLTLPSLPMTSWLLLPSGVTVEVIVVNIVSAGHIFVQQHTHPTYHALRSLDQQMFICYSQPGAPTLPSPAEVGVICAAPAVEGAWWRAQVITFYKETNEVEIRYVDYGGYDRVKIDSLRQIRSDFVTLPFQGAEVLLDNIVPLPGEDRFSTAATSALEELTRGVALLAQVSNYDNNTGLPLVHLWNMVGDEVISVNRSLAERGLGIWVDTF